MIEQMRSEDYQKQMASHSSSSSAGGQSEGYWAYMQRQMQERTENLGIMGDSMDKLEETSMGWADDVNTFIKDQKRKAVKGSKSRFYSDS